MTETGFRFASELTLVPEDPADTDRTAAEVATRLGGRVDLGVVFVSALLDDPARHAAAARTALGARTFVGCSAAGVIADGHEIERAPAVAIWAARLPDVEIDARHVVFDEDAEDRFPGSPRTSEATAGVVVLADPFTFPTDAWLETLGSGDSRVPCIGGLASGGTGPGTTELYVDADVYDRGAVAVAFSGPIRIDTVVSQGCRPIGSPYIVTLAESNLLAELAGRPALERLMETLRALDDEDRKLAQRGLHIGVVVDESRTEFDRGDFLIRNLVGIDQDNRVLAVGDVIPIGTTVQFHLRDAQSADDDLRHLFAGKLSSRPSPPEGALLFTCNGRGRNLFGAPDHDVSVLESAAPDLPVAGFFCAGEIGPIGGRSFLHGFTASTAFFSRLQ